MSSSNDITNAIIIIIIFVVINLSSVLGISIQHIKDNWKEYKCMPVIIPFSGYFGHDPTTTFNDCIQGVLSNFMGSILGPIYTVFKQISAIGAEIGKFMSMFNDIAGLFKLNFLGLLVDVYNVGTKILLGLTQFAITIQDIINKVMGIFMTVIYIFLGANLTLVSIWNGLPGQVVRSTISVVGSFG